MKTSTVKSRVTRTRGESRETLLNFLKAVYTATANTRNGLANVNSHITSVVTDMNLRKDICRKTLEEFGVISSTENLAFYKWTVGYPDQQLAKEFNDFLNARRKAPKTPAKVKSTKAQALTGTTVSFTITQPELALNFSEVSEVEEPLVNLDRRYVDQIDIVRQGIAASSNSLSQAILNNRLRIDALTEEIKKLGAENREFTEKLQSNNTVLASLDSHERVKYCLEYGRSAYKKKYQEDFDISLIKYADIDLSELI